MIENIMMYMVKKKKSGMNTAGGMGAGAVIGALVAGPHGAIVGGLLGAALGHSTEE